MASIAFMWMVLSMRDPRTRTIYVSSILLLTSELGNAVAMLGKVAVIAMLLS